MKTKFYELSIKSKMASRGSPTFQYPQQQETVSTRFVTGFSISTITVPFLHQQPSKQTLQSRSDCNVR